MDTMLEARAERLDKLEYHPAPDEADYLALLKGEFTVDNFEFLKKWDYFQGLDVVSWCDQNERDSYLFVKPTRKDTWRNNTRRNTLREKLNAVVAAVLDQNLLPEVQAYDLYGNESRLAADVADTLLKHSDGLENADEKRRLRAFYLLTQGTCVNDVAWVRTTRTEKKLSKFDPETNELKYTSRDVETVEGVQTSILPFNRFMPGDFTKYFIGDQPHLWKEYNLQYDIAYNMFNKWKNWKYVKPSAYTYDSWSDTTTQTNVESRQEYDYVRMRVYENVWRDEYAIILNGVLMTPPGMPLPSPTSPKDYSVTLTQWDLFSPNFYAGRSFVQSLHNDAALLDFFYNSLIDKARQGLEPPLVTSFRTILNRNMFKPGSVTHGDVAMKPLITHQGVTNADLSVAQFIEANIDKASVSAAFQGQQTQGASTAYEIREQMRAGLRMLGLTLYSVARMESDVAQAKLRLILEHYPEMKSPGATNAASILADNCSRTFSTESELPDGYSGRKDVTFADVPQGNVYAVAARLKKSEDEARASGRAVKKYVVDAETVRGMKYLFKVVANPSQRKSKLADATEAREDAAFALSIPTIDPQWATRLWLKSKGYDEDQALAKSAPQVQPGVAAPQGGAGRPPAAKQAAAQSQGVNNSQQLMGRVATGGQQQNQEY